MPSVDRLVISYHILLTVLGVSTVTTENPMQSQQKPDQALRADRLVRLTTTKPDQWVEVRLRL